MKNKNCYLYWGWGLMLIIFLGLTYSYYQSFRTKEGFTWSKKSITDFLQFQETINPNTQFDINMIQKQASEKELQELLETGRWPWANDTKYLYMDAVYHKPIVKINPKDSLEFAQTLYNDNAAKKLVSWNTKEGEFLLNGVLIDNGTIKCGTKGENVNDSRLIKTVQTGYNLWNGYRNLEKTVLKNDELPQEVSGFHFIKNSCNPCVALNDDYSCPFQINVQGQENNHVSEVWKSLWKL